MSRCVLCSDPDFVRKSGYLHRGPSRLFSIATDMQATGAQGMADGGRSFVHGRESRRMLAQAPAITDPSPCRNETPRDKIHRTTTRIFLSGKGAGNTAFPTHFPPEKWAATFTSPFPQSFTKQLLLHRKQSDVITSNDLYSVRWRSLVLRLS